MSGMCNKLLYQSEIILINIKKYIFKNSRSDLDTYQFQVTMVIPKIKVTARYKSSGVLILVKASGGGDYWGEYGKTINKIHFKNSYINY